MLVSVDTICVVDDEGCERNLHKVLARNLPYCKVESERTDKLAIVAAGPSVPDFLDEIRAYEHIWAVNGAYDYLVSQGVIPTGFVGADPLPGLAAYVQNPQRGTTFYLSAICDDSVYSALEGHCVRPWFPQREGSPVPGTPTDADVIQGGTTAVSRAPFVAKCLGFRDVTLYGVDSSFNGTRYCYRDGMFPEDSTAPVVCIHINGEGPFYTEMPLIQQISQLGVMATYQTWGVDFKIRCHGLMDAYMRAPMEYDAD